MDCKEAIEYIHSLEKFGIMPGLERIRYMCERLGNPQKSMKFIHVAGTNGKGSTSTLAANILSAAGYNVGLYTSPYVIEFRERIQRNGQMIEPGELAYCVERVKEIVEADNIRTTEFEVITAAAFLYFKRSKCDYVVLEVGLGGRFDATNVIDAPLACALVSVSLDHVAILGNTVAKIAAEKCGIIKEGTKAVSYPLQNKDALAVIEKTCREKDVPLILPDISKLEIKNEDINGTSASYDGIDFLLPLAGEHMIFNCITAIETVRASGIPVDSGAFSKGISASRMPARIEITGENPFIILDGGHNEDCGRALKKYIDRFIKDRRIVMVSSMMADKDCDTYLSLVAPYADVFIAAKAEVPRAMQADELCALGRKYCKNCIAVPDSHEAVKKAKELACDNDIILICGSFYLAGEIRNELLNGGNQNG